MPEQAQAQRERLRLLREEQTKAQESHTDTPSVLSEEEQIAAPSPAEDWSDTEMDLTM